MNKIDEFKKILRHSDTDKICILTNHYQIVGRVQRCLESEQENFLTVENASLCLISDVYDTQSCTQYTSSHYNLLNINFDVIAAFSFI